MFVCISWKLLECLPDLYSATQTFPLSISASSFGICFSVHVRVSFFSFPNQQPRRGVVKRVYIQKPSTPPFFLSFHSIRSGLLYLTSVHRLLVTTIFSLRLFPLPSRVAPAASRTHPPRASFFEVWPCPSSSFSLTVFLFLSALSVARTQQIWFS